MIISTISRFRIDWPVRFATCDSPVTHVEKPSNHAKSAPHEQQDLNGTTGPACFKTFATTEDTEEHRGILPRASPAIQSSRHSLSDAMRFIWPVQTSVTEAVAFWLIRPDPNQSQFITQRVMATLYSTRCSPAGQDKSSQNNNNRNVCSAVE